MDIRPKPLVPVEATGGCTPFGRTVSRPATVYKSPSRVRCHANINMPLRARNNYWYGNGLISTNFGTEYFRMDEVRSCYVCFMLMDSKIQGHYVPAFLS